RRVGGIPVIQIRVRKSVAKISAAHGYVKRSRSKSIDADAVCGFGRSIITARGTAVARGNENRNTFRNSLLVSSIVSRIGCFAVHRLTLAITDADDGRSHVAVDQVLQGDEAAKGGTGVGAGSHLD